MKKNSLHVLWIMVFTCFVISAGQAQNGRPIRAGAVGSWRVLGEKQVSFAVDKDLITVTGADIFRKLKFKIIDAPIHMIDMKVMFENGQTQDIPLNFRMEAGHESRLIDLVGAARRIKVVYFNYRTVRPGFRGRAKLILFGQK